MYRGKKQIPFGNDKHKRSKYKGKCKGLGFEERMEAEFMQSRSPVGWGRREDVSEVAFAAGALDLGAIHPRERSVISRMFS